MNQAIVTKQFIAKNASLIGSLSMGDQKYIIKHRYPDRRDFNLKTFLGVWLFVVSWMLFLWKCIRQRRNPFAFYQLYIDDMTYDPPRWVLKRCFVFPAFSKTIDAVPITNDLSDAAGVFGNNLMYHSAILLMVTGVDPQIIGVPTSKNGLSFQCSLYRWQTWIDDRIKQDRKQDSPRTNFAAELCY